MSVSRPERSCPAVARNLPLPALHIGKWTNVDFEAPRLARLIRHPMAIWRDVRVEFADLRIGEQVGHAFSIELQHFHIVSIWPLSTLLVEDETRSVTREARGSLQ